MSEQEEQEKTDAAVAEVRERRKGERRVADRRRGGDRRKYDRRTLNRRRTDQQAQRHRLETTLSEIALRADFSRIRYAQCWEDADILLEALAITPQDTCLSIASAGDNTLALLSRGPARVIALDMNPAQLACLELRVAAYRVLAHHELLELIGSRPSRRRLDLYQRCRSALAKNTRSYWDRQPELIEQGIGAAGKFEHYFRLFRKRILPLVHGRKRIARLLAGGSTEQRRRFYQKHWNNWRWRLLFRLFFSRRVMGRLGRDPEFFKYVENGVAKNLFTRTEYGLTQLDPRDNPYLQWILTGQHINALPFALRRENFESIRNNLDRLEWHLVSVEDYLAHHQDEVIHKFNLSDIFEYMSEQSYVMLLDQLIGASTTGGRLAYWNMLVPRSRPEAMADRLQPLDSIATVLHQLDKAFFYSRFVLEEVR